MENLSIDKDGWKLVCFGDVVAEPKESVKNIADSNIEHVVGLEHLDSESVHLRRSAGIEESTTFTKHFAVGDVLFGRRRAYLKKAAQAPFEGICSGDITVMRAKERLLPKLLPWIVQNEKFFDYAVKHSAGGLSPRVKFKDLANYEFLLPPKDQQAQLAELLWAMDEVIEKEICSLGKIKLLIETFREKKLCDKEFPRRYLEEGLEQIVAGKSLNGTSKPAKTGQKGVLKVSAVGAEGFVNDENKALTNQDEFIYKYQVREGDVLITRANTTELVGRTCLVSNNYPNLMLSDKTLRLDVNEKKINTAYLTEVLKSYEIRRQIEAFATGTGGAMKNISQKEIRILKIPFPKFEMQYSLSKKIINLLKNKGNIETKISTSKSLQKSLINQVF